MTAATTTTAVNRHRNIGRSSPCIKANKEDLKNTQKRFIHQSGPRNSNTSCSRFSI
jgi:hypothetical protein